MLRILISGSLVDGRSKWPVKLDMYCSCWAYTSVFVSFKSWRRCRSRNEKNKNKRVSIKNVIFADCQFAKILITLVRDCLHGMKPRINQFLQLTHNNMQFVCKKTHTIIQLYILEMCLVVFKLVKNSVQFISYQYS